jgi:lipoprotein-releasing system permease protein
LYQAVFIILRGVIIGNVIGIGLCLLQDYFTIIPLNPEVYYLDAVPVELNFWHIGLLNLGTIILCTAALIIPSYVVTKISPIKALKFD